MIKGGVSWSEDCHGSWLGQELHQSCSSDEGDQRGELRVEDDQVEDRAERSAGSEGGGRGQAGRVGQGRCVVVGDQEVVMSHPVVKVVVEVMVDNIMHWKVRYKLVMGLMMDHLSKF